MALAGATQGAIDTNEYNICSAVAQRHP